MNHHNTKGAIYNVLISGLAVLGAIALSVFSSTVTAKALLFFVAVSMLVALVSWIHMLLANNELNEQFELQELQSTREGEGLFADGEVLPRKRSREQFEKYGLPIMAILMLGVQILGLVLLAFATKEQFARVSEDSNAVIITSDQQILALIITALVGLILFIRGQFAANYSRIEKARLLQPASDSVLFGAYLFITMAAMVAISYWDQRVDAYVSLGLTILLGLMALENLLGMIFEIYRPRMPDHRKRLLYQSRLVGLIAKPENVFTTAGEVLNYQFGFKVSETWGYRFLRERLGVLIGIQVLLLWISTTVVVVQPSEVGLKTNVLTADKQADILEPGFHLKLPWPFASVDRYYPNQIHSFIVGSEEPDMEDAFLGSRPKLWQDRPWKDYEANRLSGRLYFMARRSNDNNDTVLPNIVEASIPLQYRVPREKLRSGWLNFKNPEALLQHVAYREVSAYFLENNLETLMRANNSDSQKVKDRIQTALAKAGLGVEVLFVGLKGVRPPAETPLSIKGERDPEENEAPGQNTQDNLSSVSVGEAIETVHAKRVLGKVDEKVARNSEEVAIYAGERRRDHHLRRKEDANATATSQADGKKRELQRELPLYKVSSKIYREWRYLHAFSEVVGQSRKFIIAVGPDVEVQIDLDLQESLSKKMYEIPGANRENEQ